MPFKPNYRFDRTERDRLKQAKREDKLRRQQERKAQRDVPEPNDDVDSSKRVRAGETIVARQSLRQADHVAQLGTAAEL
jgi:hypothetical protein